MRKNVLIIVGILFISAVGQTIGKETDRNACSTGYSADTVQTLTEKGKITTLHGKTYLGRLGMRTEAGPELGGGISIVRSDKKVMWMLMPAQEMYMETPIGEKSTSTNQPKGKSQIPAIDQNELAQLSRANKSVKDLGMETIDGELTDKREIIQEKNPDCKTTFNSRQDNKLVVRYDLLCKDRNITYQLKNVKLGQPPENLFEIPAGYKQFSLGAGLSEIMKTMSAPKK